MPKITLNDINEAAERGDAVFLIQVFAQRGLESLVPESKQRLLLSQALEVAASKMDYINYLENAGGTSMRNENTNGPTLAENLRQRALDVFWNPEGKKGTIEHF